MAQRIDVPAREGRATHVSAGARFRVIDVEGGQVGDFWAFCADDISEYHSTEHTRAYHNRLFPRIGEHFVTNRRRPILLFEEDTSPGVHDMLCAACDPSRYALLGVEGWHASCQENLRTAMASLGFDRVEVPSPINLFMDIPVQASSSSQSDVTFTWEPARTRSGDSVLFRAELNCYVALSACPNDIVGINNDGPGPLAIEIID
jgi:uncharacterized protein YcgI (DUF1989 family)